MLVYICQVEYHRTGMGTVPSFGQPTAISSKVTSRTPGLPLRSNDCSAENPPTAMIRIPPVLGGVYMYGWAGNFGSWSRWAYVATLGSGSRWKLTEESRREQESWGVAQVMVEYSQTMCKTQDLSG